MKTQTLEIQGMSCGSCVHHVTETLRRVEGVEVSLVAIGTATVCFDSAAVKFETITGALAAAGYPARAWAENRVVETGRTSLPVLRAACCCA